MTDRRKRRKFFRATPLDRQISADDEQAYADYKAERERLNLTSQTEDDG